MDNQQYDPNNQGQNGQYSGPGGGTDNTKLYSILSYLGPLFIVGLVMDPDNQRVRFHVNQGIVLLITWVVLGFATGIVSLIIGWIPFVGSLIRAILGLVAGGGGIALMIVGIIHAANDELTPLPIIGGIEVLK